MVLIGYLQLVVVGPLSSHPPRNGLTGLSLIDLRAADGTSRADGRAVPAGTWLTTAVVARSGTTSRRGCPARQRRQDRHSAVDTAAT
ncbi:MAG: hypothetical protein ABJD68_15540, partial [Nakamurella sp.]